MSKNITKFFVENYSPGFIRKDLKSTCDVVEVIDSLVKENMTNRKKI